MTSHQLVRLHAIGSQGIVSNAMLRLPALIVLLVTAVSCLPIGSPADATRAGSAASITGAEPSLAPGAEPNASSDPSTTGATYFVDCAAGADTNTGTSEAEAWSSLGKASGAPLVAGDRLLLKRGCSWTGPLSLRWRGTASQPVTVGAYGEGDLPQIRNAQDNVLISGSHLLIENLSTSADAPSVDANCRNQGVGKRIGFRFRSGASFNTLRQSLATHLSNGVLIDQGSHNNRIISSEFAQNDLMDALTPKTENPDDDAGAIAIAIQGEDNEVAYNRIHDNVACSYDYDTDGSAVEIYGGQRNSIHHNRAWGNDVFTELGDARSTDNLYAYNINTGSYFLTTRGNRSHFGPVSRTRAYNNVSYSDATGAVVCGGGCGPEILTLKNNIFWVGKPAIEADGPFDEAHNIYWSKDRQPRVDISLSGSSLIADPRFVDAASGDFRVRRGSPAIDAGVSDVVEAGFTGDFVGSPVPSGVAVDVGAYEHAGE